MTTLAIIGGTGLTRMDGLTVTRREMVKTPYGAPSCPIVFGELGGREVAFMARHGVTHRIPPHRVNYCANIWALNSVGIEQIIAVGAVGGIHKDCTVGSIVIPHQIIDYTSARENTFFDGGDDPVEHIDFSYPYNEQLRQALIDGAKSSPGITLVDSGVYGVTQGPRLETAAEIVRMANDGCTIVGMTGMPEAALAAELGIAYACCGVVVNAAAGIDNKPIDTTALPAAIQAAMKNACKVLNTTLRDGTLMAG
ncbi:S-methyl-5'-thioinosine phosphorylase [Granulosicoccus antarcticus]|uniref:Probable 6-oxopurine nucleoside phosphorylase n=1 Tax=Granulosicoccus antarcticus IMCC3135 TaxID=1192854 RepID=A0A2Z2NWF3_9GAMM|nr:S-methyl-5'-thioinosine phosphorylase [Granulosicoccus antarcticus]ASJ74825.1 S-methyl-5'-thioinosine phosphorylase [Granulosicoccus antarcticus IMCC3135]